MSTAHFAWPSDKNEPHVTKRRNENQARQRDGFQKIRRLDIMQAMQKQLELLKKYEISVRGVRGQHFLIDPNIQRKIVSLVDPKPSDLIVEIGPGLGALTQELLLSGARVLAIEMDGRFCEILKSEYHDLKNLTVVQSDILSLSLERLLQKHAGRLASKCKVVGNIPYYITSPILLFLISFRRIIDQATLMIPKEILNRLLAQPGTKDYGRLTLLARFYFEIERTFPVSRNCFSPKPRVDSNVIQLSFHGKEPQVNETQFFEIVKHAFGQRRKNILNALSHGYKNVCSKEKIEAALHASGIKPTQRGEELLLKDFLKLAEVLGNYK